MKMMPKSDGPQHCNNNVVTPMGFDFSCRPGVRKNRRGVDTICASNTLYFVGFYIGEGNEMKYGYTQTILQFYATSKT